MTASFDRMPFLVLILVFGVMLSAGVSLLVSPVSLELSWLWSSGQSLEKLILIDLLASRTLMALLCGAALGIAGVLIQQTTRNSFASPATLGVNAGALLATILGTAFAPALMAKAPVAVAFVGAVVVTLLVIRLSRLISHSPVNLVLVGMAMTLALGSVSAGLMMFLENSLEGLYTWGAGNLTQHDFQAFKTLWPWVIALSGLAWWMGRSLDLMELGESNAKSLGVNVSLLVNGALGVALLLSSMVVSELGMISFIGLVAPHIARSFGFRFVRSRLLMSAAVGALLLLWADIMARMLSGQEYSIPAGAMTTLLGAPFLIVMLTRKQQGRGSTVASEQAQIAPLFRGRPPFTLCALVVLMLGMAVLSLGGSQIALFWELRVDRVFVSLLAGGILGLSGLLLQTLLKNPLASPDVSGLTTSGVLFAVLGVVLIPGISSQGIMLMTLLGSSCALMLLLVMGRLTGFQPQLFALTGLCLSALAATLINILLVLGSNQATDVLVWLSGSTYHSDADGVLLLMVGTVLLIAVAALCWRKLDILSLGSVWPGLLGIRTTPLMVLVFAVLALASSFAVSVVGGISFIGLMAPHLCRLAGLSSHRYLVPATAMTGGILLITGDMLSRSLMYPFELPAGLVVSCVGGVYFLSLLLAGKYLRRS